ncbi:MAG: conserved phage C-terminal domain-containing protein [Campylobacterales bacterium]|nr:conserved phage C-terminal domain-containing protein [Campylobacterales bacterium]
MSAQFESDVSEILAHLNEVCQSRFKPTTPKTKSLIRARLSEGFSVDDFRLVHVIKAAEWKNTKFESYLRPITLYGTKFESYLNQKMSDAQKIKMIMQATGKSAAEVRDMMMKGAQGA